MSHIDHAQKLVYFYQEIEGKLEIARFAGLLNQSDLDRINDRLTELQTDIVSIMGLGWFESAIGSRV